MSITFKEQSSFNSNEEINKLNDVLDIFCSIDPYFKNFAQMFSKINLITDETERYYKF